MGQPETGGGKRRGDLLGQAFPPGDWTEPAAHLTELYQWVEQRALRTVDWYLADRVWKRRGARLLRAGTAAGVAAGAALPLLELAGALASGGAVWGLLALLAAATCHGCDRCFGLTAGWMRSVATAQAVQRRLEAMQYEWAAESVREVLGPPEGTASEAVERCLAVLRRFSEDVTELVRLETADWMAQFRTGPVPAVSRQATPPGRQSRQDAARAAGSGRSALPPGVRPHMPRQRPPEPPR